MIDAYNIYDSKVSHLDNYLGSDDIGVKKALNRLVIKRILLPASFFHRLDILLVQPACLLVGWSACCLK